jgi:hypothetical protein
VLLGNVRTEHPSAPAIAPRGTIDVLLLAPRLFVWGQLLLHEATYDVAKRAELGRHPRGNDTAACGRGLSGGAGRATRSTSPRRRSKSIATSWSLFASAF